MQGVKKFFSLAKVKWNIISSLTFVLYCNSKESFSTTWIGLGQIQSKCNGTRLRLISIGENRRSEKG